MISKKIKLKIKILKVIEKITKNLNGKTTTKETKCLAQPRAKRLTLQNSIFYASKDTYNSSYDSRKVPFLPYATILHQFERIEHGKFASFFEDGTQGIRMNYYYPPFAQATKFIRLTPPSDSIALTLLTLLPKST